MGEDFYELLLRDDSGDSVKLAIQSGFRVDQHLPNGFTPLVAAAMLGNAGAVEALISAGANVHLDARKSTEGQTPLHAAAQGGWGDICRALIAAGASVRSVDRSRATPLHAAAGMGFADICGLLLEKGADVSAKNKFKGATPLQVAVANGAQGTAGFVLDAMERDMAAEGHILPRRDPRDPFATVLVLLKNGVTRKDVSKAVKWAKVYGSDELVRLLSFHG